MFSITSIRSAFSYTKATVPYVYSIRSINTNKNIVRIFLNPGSQLARNTDSTTAVRIGSSPPTIVPVVNK